MSEDSGVLWPPLPLAEWKATRDTLHMYTQVVGKIRLHLAPMEPQWAQVPLYVTARGLTTTPIPFGDGIFEVQFDFIDHKVYIYGNDGAVRRLALLPRPVAAFYQEVMEALRSIGVSVAISTTPSEVEDPIPFPDDQRHAAYDAEYVHRFWQILVQADTVLKAWRARFRGKASPVQFFWGTFDLATARYSGRAAEPPPNSGRIRRLGMDAEEVASGFWPGDDRFPEPAFYSYTYPKPPGIEAAALRPSAAIWSDSLGEFILKYEDLRRASSPREAIMEFLESTYEAGATCGGWDRAALEEPTA